jgi:membrane dipeptidase
MKFDIAKFPVFDGHIDLPLALFDGKNLDFKQKKPLGPVASLPALREGNVKAFLCAVYLTNEQDDIIFWKLLEKTKRFIQAETALTSEKTNLNEDKISAILWIENLGPTTGPVEEIAEKLFQNDVRGVILAWGKGNRFSACSGESGGLNKDGKEFIKLANKLNIVLDISHLSDKASLEVLDTAEKVCASHSGFRSIKEHPRNLSDTIAKKLYQRKGVHGLVFYPDFLGGKNGQEAVINT